MRALRKTAPRPGAELGDVPVPEPGEGEVLVRVHAAAITRDAVEELGLVEGARATAAVKATSVMVER